VSTDPGTAPRRPGPPPNPVTEPFWSGLRQGRLELQRCAACAAVQHYPRALCTTCWSTDLGWTTSPGTGAVWTWTVVHRPGHPAFAEDVPYAVVVVELDEGPRLVTSWDGPLDVLALGLRVRVTGRPVDDHAVAVARPEDSEGEPRTVSAEP
jgi:uncharacterized OB-fold protein